MATLIIRDLEADLESSLRVRAMARGRSMEDEARHILQAALAESRMSGKPFVERVRARFEGLGDIRLPIEPR